MAGSRQLAKVDTSSDDFRARFADEYVIDCNLTAAYKRAGGSAKSAHQLGFMMMKDPRVQELVRARMRDLEQDSRIKTYRVLDELAALAFSNIAHYRIAKNGNVRLAPDAPRGAMRAVSAIKRRVTRRADPINKTVTIETIETEIRLWDKNPALTNAMKRLGLLVDRHEHTGKDGGPIQTAQVQLYLPDNGRSRR